ncbi:MAG TPA: Ldh family oxidoreductase [Burkholderiales bacterium]|nr:Ldh family oxidoreductase [Burkholderiales bacterium]
MPPRYAAAALRRFAARLLERAGLASDRAADVAEILVEGDLMGHTTHGLQLLGPYLKALEDGVMTRAGQPVVVADRGGSIAWDGDFLPGPWLVLRAMDAAFARVAALGVVAVAIRRAHHIACLQAYLPRATDRGLVMLLMSSDPATRSVAPHGAIAGRFTPNPIAAGFPTAGLPVLIDISASTTTNGLVSRLNRAGTGGRLPGPWLVDNRGNASDDPAVMLTNPPGAILPLGGMDLGHKGFGLALLVEALTSALAGHGRADGEAHWGASVFVQIIDPGAFGGRDAFARETAWLAAACRAAPVKAGNPPVRLPGERGLKLRALQLAEGVVLHPETMPALVPWAEKLGVPLP